MATSPPYPTHPTGPTGGALRHAHWWQKRWVRYGALSTLLALSGLVILALVREQTGTEGFLVGLGLAVLPVPLLVASFRWLDRVEPGPWRNLLFSFAWGACAAALIAIIANSFATRWIATATADPSHADTLGATVIAPVVEETAKAAAILLVFLFRRRDFTGIVDGVVIAGVTATGFAFTENILYLGTAFGTDQLSGDSGIASVTAATFFVRVIMSPFAHPLFTVLTGIGFGIAALSGPRQPVRRVLLPLFGLLLAMGMHALWNGSSAFGEFGFFAVYAAFMVPAFGLLTWLVIWTRQRELRTVREELPAYVVAGWLTPVEPFALGSMRARRVARQYARQRGGRTAARAVAQYEAYATSLAFLRHRGRRGRAGADFVVREQELLHELWGRRGFARPALEHAVAAQPRAAYGYGHGYGYGAPGQWPPYGPGHAARYGPTQGAAHGPTQGAPYGPAAPYPAYNPYRT
ncbi:Membrane proteinase PrsW, cleaves anti-sigma factor RsiW, M82 family [Streptomyces sp. cf386]|uniref:PrsW family intramembrane metalloprotease n=1 Tax=Streptomyces sp. cf386 TaxID=1761904 RepID=UPI0008911A02|nr:PrsW family intramembrane metalloprotease [Streptomyces sp. cf386]SDP51912.1 Membrane proteinase PrsW, cleaves anti-sigma factor RsiW, M82 family [Streptomyces sp. cf386]